jgi:hypothetical protein
LGRQHADWRYEASRNHDASEPFSGDMKTALARINDPVLLLSSSTDRTVTAYLTDELEHDLSNVKRVVFETATASWVICNRQAPAIIDRSMELPRRSIESIPD